MMMTLKRLLNESKEILLPLASLTIALVSALLVADRLPAVIAKVRAEVIDVTVPLRTLKFASIEEAEKSLGVRIALPAYFPDYLIWPATTIYAQREPLIVTLLFRAADLREGLIIRQSFTDVHEQCSLLPAPFVTIRREAVQLGEGADAMLVEGEDGNGHPRNQIWWHTSEGCVVLETPYPTIELLRLARSVR